MGYNDNFYNFEVKDLRTGDGLTAGVFTFVYTAGSKTLATLYSDSARTSLANPITRAQFATDGQIQFYAEAASVDIFINDSLGNCSMVYGVTPYDHVVTINRDGVYKKLIAAHGAETSETDTGLDFPYDSLITRVVVEVVTVDATETIDVGLLSSETAGDANGLLAAASVATAGFVAPAVITVGSNDNYISTAYYGALMGTGLAGADVATDTGQPGGLGHFVTGSNAVSLTYTCSAGSDTAAGYIHASFEMMR